ncbi:hypothetical protein HanHA300_Chr11g0397471 [Helianthus annuus]|nr:hypothetical protein HanHA300_Chr11g0397471 [Helianthus annuus]KAJ0517044.1 hypothetical protein HanHA89_Chr11g0420781 [Helianthus annuus]KAJ0685053.1 hypothetical protein HanLR1_Chr11g0398191 [Helianthus annuus]
MRACSFSYEHLSLNVSLLLYIRARKSPYAHAPLHTSTPASMPACCSTYEHTSLLPSLVVYIRVRKSPRAHAPLHTCISVSKQVCCSTYEHVSCDTLILPYERAHMRGLAHTPLLTTSLHLRAITNAPAGACSSTYEQVSPYERAHMLLYIRRSTPAPLHTSISVFMRVCCSTYEHTSFLASLLLYIRASKSPYAHAPFHTSISVPVRACRSTYEHVSRHARMLLYILYIRAYQSQC